MLLVEGVKLEWQDSPAKTAYRWGGSLQVCIITRKLFVLLLMRDIYCKLWFLCYMTLSLENSTKIECGYKRSPVFTGSEGNENARKNSFSMSLFFLIRIQHAVKQLQLSTCTHTTFRSGRVSLLRGFHWSWPNDGRFIKIAEYYLNYNLLRTWLLSTRFWNQTARWSWYDKFNTASDWSRAGILHQARDGFSYF